MSMTEFGFENWELRNPPKRKMILNLKNHPDVVIVLIKGKLCPACGAPRSQAPTSLK